MVGEDASEQRSITSLDGKRAQKFLRSLADRPFVAVVLEDDVARVYCKNVEPDTAARIMQSLVYQIESEDT